LTYSDQFIFCASCKVSSIRAEADASDVQITDGVDRLILEDADFLSSHDIKNLCRSVAAGGYIFSVVAEADAAHNTLVLKSVDKINIKYAGYLRVEDSKPVRLDFLLVGW
jgi:hypothetical protein